MKLIVILFSIVTLLTGTLSAQNEYLNLDDLSGGIVAGYGAWGTNNVIKETTLDLPIYDGNITCYHPDIAATQLPTIFFVSGWGRDVTTYDKFFRFLASKGYSVINIYNNTPGNIVSSYTNAKDMLIQAANVHYSNWIDTTKIGLMGHSFGAGATVWIGNEIFNPTTHNFGSQGRFIFMSAPWFSLVITAEQLQNYPPDVKLLIEINNDDLSVNPDYTWNTDERAIRAVYELINIPDSEKDLVKVLSTAIDYQYNGETYAYDANHYVSYTQANSDGVYQPYDALDVYALNRLSDALIQYTFNNDLTAKNMALGNGSPEQIDMSFLTDLNVTDNLIVTRPEADFAYRCVDGWNDFEDGAQVWNLQNYCTESVLSINNNNKSAFLMYPNPVKSTINIGGINVNDISNIYISDVTGKILKAIHTPNSLSIDVSFLSNGVYFFIVEAENKSSTNRFIISE